MRDPIWVKRLAIFFAILAVALTGAAFWPAQMDALWCPVELQPGFSATHQFRVPKKADYRIEIRSSRSIPFEQLKKQLRQGNLVEVKLLQDGAPVEMGYFQNPPVQPWRRI
jgi:hypothetical protein